MNGLGDLIQWASATIGIKPCPNCLRRKDYLNALVPFGKGEAAMMDDGSLVFPAFGPIPRIPDGYERSTNPYVLRLSLPDCDFRKKVKVPASCCSKSVERLVCSKYCERTDALNCRNCIDSQTTKNQELNNHQRS